MSNVSNTTDTDCLVVVCLAVRRAQHICICDSFEFIKYIVFDDDVMHTIWDAWFDSIWNICATKHSSSSQTFWLTRVYSIYNWMYWTRDMLIKEGVLLIFRSYFESVYYEIIEKKKRAITVRESATSIRKMSIK